MVRDPSRGTALLNHGVELAVGDLRDSQSLQRALEGIEIVYHIAALFRPENVTRTEMWETNVQGTRNLLDMAVKEGVHRFVHCSTVGVHGDVKDGPADEEAPYAPGDHYQWSKTEGERVVKGYMIDDVLPIVVFRPAGIYGPRDLRFLKLIRAIKSGRFVMLGSGEVKYQLVYIDDLVEGILLCGTEEAALGNVYILTGEEPVTLNELVKVIAAVLDVRFPRLRFPITPVYLAGFLCELIFKPLGIHPPLYRRRVDFFRKNRSFNISKAKRELAFCPATDLKTGIERTVDWYQANGYL